MYHFQNLYNMNKEELNSLFLRVTSILYPMEEAKHLNFKNMNQIYDYLQKKNKTRDFLYSLKHQIILAKIELNNLS